LTVSVNRKSPKKCAIPSNGFWRKPVN
jgi:hypothetical protein